MKILLPIFILLSCFNAFASSDKIELGFSIVSNQALGSLEDKMSHSFGGQVEVTFPYYFRMDVLTQVGFNYWQVDQIDLKYFSGMAGFRIELYKLTQTSIDLGLALHLVQGETPQPMLLTDKESDFGLEYGTQLLKVDGETQWISLSAKIIQLWTKPSNSFFFSTNITWGWSWPS